MGDYNWSNLITECHRFAIAKSISQIPANRFIEPKLKLNDRVQIKLDHKHPGSGKIGMTIFMKMGK